MFLSVTFSSHTPQWSLDVTVHETENAEVENAGADHTGGKCRSCRVSPMDSQSKNRLRQWYSKLNKNLPDISVVKQFTCIIHIFALFNLTTCLCPVIHR